MRGRLISFVSTILVPVGIFGMMRNASAQAVAGTDRAPHVELWGAITGVASGPSNVLTTSYSPPLLFDGDFTSHAGQTLEVNPGHAIGFAAGINVFRGAHVGFQVLADRVSRDVGGSNTDYTLNLQYVSRPPPDGTPVPVSIDQSLAWPDTSGTLTQTAVAFNAVVRLGRPGHIGVTISGGPAYYRLTGAVEPVAYTAFHLGGHSVLFGDDYRLAMDLVPANVVGFDAGGELNVPAGHHAAFFAGYRFFGGPKTDVAATPTSILNPDQVFFTQPLADIASRLAPTSMRTSVSRSQVLVGLKIMFR